MKTMKFWGCTAAVLLLGACLATAAEVRLDVSEHAVAVFLDEKPFTTYRFHYGQKPVFWPVRGPSGVAMTRDYPMRDPNPKASPWDSFDHIHQRSLWLTHGEVNGIDFWAEGDGSGIIRHVEIVRAEAPTLVTRNEWTTREGRVLLEELRTMTFGAEPQGRWIDLDVRLTATQEDVRFGDTKEGTLGLRVPGVLDVDKKQGGQIVNSNGQTDVDAWGKRAAWVDYHGTVDGQPVGIAILNHPQSFRFPTYWHVRTYGLFAANPFGVGDFTGDKTNPGDFLLKRGETLRLRHRLYFHNGDEKIADVEGFFRRYSELP